MALNMVRRRAGLQIVQPMWDGYDSVKALRVLKQHWVKHYGWPEIVIHDQGPEFMGHAIQVAMAAQGIRTVPIDSQSPWQNGKPNVREHRSNYNCGTWTRSATLKDEMILQMLAQSLVLPGTTIAADPDIQHINECSDHRSGDREAY